MGTTLEALAPYLPYGIEVKAPQWTSPGRLTGLATSGGVSVDGGAYRYGEAILPVLRSFDQLCTPLEDGTVPVDEIRQLWGLQAMNGETAAEYNEMVHRILQGTEIGKYAMSIDVSFEDVATAIDYLRSKHFAVGLTSEQYIRKA